MNVIYEPKGRAKEYADLAVNLYNGCSHGCEYCYAPQVMHKKREDFFRNPTPRKEVIPKLVDDVETMTANNDDREVLMCFSCDPYQPLDNKCMFARRAIKLFEDNGINYAVLTKGGKRSERDFDVMNNCRYGTTLVFEFDKDSLKYEPGAAPTSERIIALRHAHDAGLKTWASLEPTWSLDNIMGIISEISDDADEIKIGKLNYHPHAKEIHWGWLKEAIVDYCENQGVNYTLKRDLAVL